MSKDDQIIFYLARKGYGSVNELNEWDTPELFNALEFEHINNDIERHMIEVARNGTGH